MKLRTARNWRIKRGRTWYDWWSLSCEVVVEPSIFLLVFSPCALSPRSVVERKAGIVRQSSLAGFSLFMCSWVSATRCDRILVPILLIVVLIFCAGARSVEGSSSLWIQASASNGPQVSRHVAGAVHDTIIVHGGFVTVFGFTSISSSLYLWKWGMYHR